MLRGPAAIHFWKIGSRIFETQEGLISLLPHRRSLKFAVSHAKLVRHFFDLELLEQMIRSGLAVMTFVIPRA